MQGTSSGWNASGGFSIFDIRHSTFGFRVHLTLFIPGLCGPKARFSNEYLPDVPALNRLLSRGSLGAPVNQSFHFTLARLFGCAPPSGQDVPVAAVTHQLDAAGVGQGIWMRADPVYLRADMRSVILLDAQSVRLDTRDALALAAEVKPLLESQGYQLEVPCPERWYLRLQVMPQISTTELEQVMGRDIASALPAGPDSASWRRLLNEIQMLLHQSAVNTDRETRALAPINSLWFWGCGPTPTPVPQRWTAIHGTDLFLRGLAEVGGSVCLPVPSGANECLANAEREDRVLVVMENCRRAAAGQEVEVWSAAVRELEQRWFKPLAGALQKGALRSLSLITDGLELEVRQLSLLCLWRRQRTLASLAPGVASP